MHLINYKFTYILQEFDKKILTSQENTAYKIINYLQVKINGLTKYI